MEFWVLIITAVTTICYAGIIAIFTFAWFRGKNRPVTRHTHTPMVSVIIAVRNEKHNINNLISHLLQQDYPSAKTEIIFSDDFSEDNTVELLKAFASQHSCISIVCSLPGNKPGKKAALRRALETAAGEIILTTDADCTLPVGWISAMTKSFQYPEVKMVLGPVRIKSQNCFAHLQSLEFIALMASTAASANLGKPIMGNAANMAYRKELFQHLACKIKGNELSSGDDIFLLHATQKIYPGSIVFARNQEAIADTLPAESLKTFFSQRIRWASKGSKYNDPFTLFVAYTTAFFNLALVAITVLSLINTIFLPYGIMMWIIKIVMDFWLVSASAQFFSGIRLLRYYIIVQIIYPFYVTLTLLLALLVKPAWKNRKIK